MKKIRLFQKHNRRINLICQRKLAKRYNSVSKSRPVLDVVPVNSFVTCFKKILLQNTTTQKKKRRGTMPFFIFFYYFFFLGCGIFTSINLRLWDLRYMLHANFIWGSILHKYNNKSRFLNSHSKKRMVYLWLPHRILTYKHGMGENMRKTRDTVENLTHISINCDSMTSILLKLLSTRSGL